jgi:exosome complex component MTR3
MTDRRRINGPSGGTSAPVYSKYLTKDASDLDRPTRTRAPNVLRKMCMYEAFLLVALI